MKNVQTVIHIGFPKTGSTFLQAYFQAHTDVYHNRERFRHYIKTGVINNEIIKDKVDCSKFDVLSEELLSIWSGIIKEEELSTYSLDYDISGKQSEVAKDLKTLFPDAKVLVVFRNYVSLVPALYSQYLLSGGTSSISKLLKTKQEQNLSLFNYDYIIRIYYEVFGKDKVVLLPFEFLQENPKEFLLHVENTFNLPHFEFPIQKIHGSLNTTTACIVRMMNVWMHFRLYFIRGRKKRKERFINYIKWLFDFKEKLNKKLKIGRKIHIPIHKLKLQDFKNQSKLVRFDGVLSKYNKYYE